MSMLSTDNDCEEASIHMNAILELSDSTAEEQRIYKQYNSNMGQVFSNVIQQMDARILQEKKQMLKKKFCEGVFSDKICLDNDCKSINSDCLQNISSPLLSEDVPGAFSSFIPKALYEVSLEKQDSCKLRNEAEKDILTNTETTMDHPVDVNDENTSLSCQSEATDSLDSSLMGDGNANYINICVTKTTNSAHHNLQETNLIVADEYYQDCSHKVAAHLQWLPENNFTENKYVSGSFVF